MRDTKKSTTEMFINKANKIHNNKYDYSLVNYKNNQTKIEIVCLIHGSFNQTPNTHLRGSNCPKCYGRNKTNNEIIEEFKQVHVDKYDYSKINYIKSTNKIDIICPIHGIFKQTPKSHLRGSGCNKCAGRNKTTEEFINECKLIHKNKYNYELVEYKSPRNKILIICPNHGMFEQKAMSHLHGNGCDKCGGTMELNNSIFIDRSNIIHDNKYDYSLVNYINNRTKVKILCPINDHGIFTQIPDAHLRGVGCPICKESHGERQIRIWLKNNKFNFESQKRFDDCRNEQPLPFDFYLPELNICIEFHGLQHYEPFDRFGGEEQFKIQKLRDKIKEDYCKNNSIQLIVIKYNDNIEDKLKEIL